MKFNYKYVFVILAVFAFASCEDYIGGDINADPNNPTFVPVGGQLPAVEVAMADLYGGAFSRFSCMLSQQVEGVARHVELFQSVYRSYTK